MIIFFPSKLNSKNGLLLGYKLQNGNFLVCDSISDSTNFDVLKNTFPKNIRKNLKIIGLVEDHFSTKKCKNLFNDFDQFLLFRQNNFRPRFVSLVDQNCVKIDSKSIKIVYFPILRGYSFDFDNISENSNFEIHRNFVKKASLINLKLKSLSKIVKITKNDKNQKYSKNLKRTIKQSVLSFVTKIYFPFLAMISFLPKNSFLCKTIFVKKDHNSIKIFLDVLLSVLVTPLLLKNRLILTNYANKIVLTMFNKSLAILVLPGKTRLFDVHICKFLANFILNIFYILMISVLFFVNHFNTIVYICIVFCSFIGFSMIIALIMDIIKLALKPLKIIYKKYLKIDSFFKYCICVFRDLFRGRRRNVLSGRFDYLPHQIDQFILGTVFLSLTIFIYPTIFIYKLILGFLYLFSLSINVSMLFLHNILLKIDMFAVIATIFNKNWDFEDCSNFFLTFDFEENYRNSKVCYLELRRSIDYFKILKYLLPSKSDFTNL